MLLQTNSYIVPKERRAEHARLIRRFRQALARIGCDQFEVYEQVGANWSPGGANGRYVQIMRFRDRQHQQAVQSAERGDPGAQQIIAEFCELINFPYQHQHGYFATGFYTSVIPIGPRQAVEYQPEEVCDEQAATEGAPVEGVATEEIDATEFESTPTTGAAGYVEQQVTEEPEPEADIDLDDAPATPDLTSGAPEPLKSADDVSLDSQGATEHDSSPEVNPDLLGEGDLQLEPEVVTDTDIASTAQIAQSHFGSAEIGLLEPAIPMASAAPAADELPLDLLSSFESEATEATALAPETTDESPAIAGELLEPLPQAPTHVPAEPSPEANLFLPESPEIWEIPTAAEDPSAIEHAVVDEIRPIDGVNLTDTDHAETVLDGFDPLDSGLIFDEEPIIGGTSGASDDEFNDHAFAFDEPQLQSPASEGSLKHFSPPGGRPEATSLYSAHDDLMPPALESPGSDRVPLAAESAFSEHSVDALLDDAHLIDHVPLPGAQSSTPKVHASHEPAGVHGVDSSSEKDAELLEFEAMIRDLQDPSAEHGKRAN